MTYRPADAAELARLRRFVLLDTSTTSFAVAVILAAYLLVEPTGWLLVLAAIVVAAGATMGAALRPLRSGEVERAVRWVSVANWSVALATSAIAPFCWPLQLLAALLPAVIAAPHVSGDALRRYLGVSLAVSVAVAATGLLQDFSGFQEQMPEWSTDGIVLLFTPFMGAMVVLTALQHSNRLQGSLDAMRASRRRVVEATDRERRRVERDIHDGAQARLTALRVALRLAEQRCRTEPERMGEVFEALRADVQATHDELRDLAHGIYPTVLTQHGLVEALQSSADRCPLPVSVDLAAVGRHPAEIEAAVYFCCAEALHNAVAHAGADATVSLSTGLAGGALWFAVRDDGSGFDVERIDGAHGLENLRDRMQIVGGALEILSTPGAGTMVTGRVPVDRR